MRVVISGTSTGIGRAIAQKFLENPEYTVYGIDIKDASIEHPKYTHCKCDVSNKGSLPEICDVDILVNNAGAVYDDERAIDVNLKGLINCTEKYALQKNIKSVINIVSSSAHNGAEFPLYAASKGGALTYTKWTALEIAKYGATCNSISPGGVYTNSNKRILDNKELTEEVMNETMLGKWTTESEIADWVVFIAGHNKSVTSQDILIDNGELAKANFVW